MKPVLFAIGITTLLLSIEQPATSSEKWTIAISGNTRGYLSPCGCTQPMSGGIRRRNTVIHQLRASGKSLYIDAGGFVEGTSRQDALKAEALAEAAAAADVDGIAVTRSEWNLGEGALGSLSRLAGDRFISTEIDLGSNVPAKSCVSDGPFRIFTQGVDAPTWGSVRQTLISEIESTQMSKQIPIILLSGNRDAAESMAKSISGPGLVVYRSTGSPTAEPEMIGEVLICTPGDKGKELLTVVYEQGKFSTIRIHGLAPNVSDDPKTSRIYSAYKLRVDREKLLEAIPKFETPRYAGSASCSPCHTITYELWKKSKHFVSMQTLEADHSHRDPDCVGCHVTGLDSKSGYKAFSAPTQFGSVGCESCHGPSYSHAKNPKIRTSGASLKSCSKCHTSETSPKFDFKAYWDAIKHR